MAIALDGLRCTTALTPPRIQIAHTDIKRFDSPEHEPFDRYVIKLHARAAALLQEHSDVVLFANYRISTVKSDIGFNKKVTRARSAPANGSSTPPSVPPSSPRTDTASEADCYPDEPGREPRPPAPQLDRSHQRHRQPEGARLLLRADRREDQPRDGPTSAGWSP